MSWSLGNRAMHVMTKWWEQKDACGENKLQSKCFCDLVPCQLQHGKSYQKMWIFISPKSYSPSHIHTNTHTHTHTHQIVWQWHIHNACYHIFTHKIRAVNKILLPTWHKMICWFCKYRCQNNDYVSHLFHEWFSFVRTNITEVNTVTRISYMSTYSLCIRHTNLKTRNHDSTDTMEYRKKVDHALLRVWLHIIWETRTDASNQPVASISRIFYPEDVNSILLRRQVHIHQMKTASHPKTVSPSLSQPPTTNCQCCSRKLPLIVK